MDGDDIAVFNVITQVQRHGEGQFVTAAFIDKSVGCSVVILVDITAFEVYSTQVHDFLVHLTGGQMIAEYADNLSLA